MITNLEPDILECEVKWALESITMNKASRGDWKRSVFIPIPKKGSIKECSDYHTIALISQTSKVMLKIVQARLQQYVNFHMFRLVLEKAEEPEIKLQTSTGSLVKPMSSKKHLFLLY